MYYKSRHPPFEGSDVGTSNFAPLTITWTSARTTPVESSSRSLMSLDISRAESRSRGSKSRRTASRKTGRQKRASTFPFASDGSLSTRANRISSSTIRSRDLSHLLFSLRTTRQMLCKRVSISVELNLSFSLSEAQRAYAAHACIRVQRARAFCPRRGTDPVVHRDARN
jgi:hypothetical protein